MFSALSCCAFWVRLKTHGKTSLLQSFRKSRTYLRSKSSSSWWKLRRLRIRLLINWEAKVLPQKTCLAHNQYLLYKHKKLATQTLEVQPMNHAISINLNQKMFATCLFLLFQNLTAFTIFLLDFWPSVVPFLIFWFLRTCTSLGWLFINFLLKWARLHHELHLGLPSWSQYWIAYYCLSMIVLILHRLV